MLIETKKIRDIAIFLIYIGALFLFLGAGLLCSSIVDGHTCFIFNMIVFIIVGLIISWSVFRYLFIFYYDVHRWIKEEGRSFEFAGRDKFKHEGFFKRIIDENKKKSDEFKNVLNDDDCNHDKETKKEVVGDDLVGLTELEKLRKRRSQILASLRYEFEIDDFRQKSRSRSACSEGARRAL